MLNDKKGNVVVLAGNNREKTEYIKEAINAGLNVLADKPMAINTDDFDQLVQTFESASRQGLILYDIMTERSEITTILQKELSLDKVLFGTLEVGSSDKPAVTKESVHHFFKYVSGLPLKRPEWFFDILQQGEGLTDVSTHLVDLIQWACFPEQIIDYTKDIEIISADRSATELSPSQFRKVTQQKAYPAFLMNDVKDSMLFVYSNGVMHYTIKGVFAKVSVVWNFEAPEGTGDTHFSIMRGTKANLIIRQGKEQQYKPALYIEPASGISLKAFRPVAEAAVAGLQLKYPDIHLKTDGKIFEIVIPDHYRIGHEEHFAQVMERFLKYVEKGILPEWEVPNMIAKYYTTTKAWEMAGKK
jgi:predicted dehydrogenase